MRILAAGGGSGGHVTPVVAVLRELKSRDQAIEVKFWCDRKFLPQARTIISHFDESIPVESVVSGKLRRYHSLPLWRQLLHLPTVGRNFVDGFLVTAGFVQSLVKLVWWRPDVVFTKGGYVCLPIGLAAALLKIPLVIHDSDAHPGLTNRILARFASRIATGAPLEHYPYPKSKSDYVGIPISRKFKPFGADEQAAAKREIGISQSRPLVVVTGGGLGAKRLNDAVVDSLDDLLELSAVVLISGSAQYDKLRPAVPANDDSFQLHPFIAGNMSTYMGAADIVVARAGATTILELAALHKPTILVPNRYLTGGHQLKNAAVYAEKSAVKIIDEADLVEDSGLLVDAVGQLLSNPTETSQMAARFGQFAKPESASHMADIILAASRR